MAVSPRQLLPLLALVLAAACSFHADYSGSDFTCPTPSSHCPSGFHCEAAHCVAGNAIDAAPAGGDGPIADAPPADAMLTVCQLAAEQPPNDNCAGAIDLTAAALMPGGVTTWGNTATYANNFAPAVIVGCTDKPEPGNDAVYRLDLLAGDMVTMTMTPDTWDGAVYLLDACTGSATCLGGSDVGAAGQTESKTLGITTAGAYDLIVDAETVSSSGCYTLSVTIAR